MDAWWENLGKAYGAWQQAIQEADLTGQYRQVEQGEWHLWQENTDNLYDGPLPWDHLDTGIDKQWLKEDLQKALEAATVPDCSFEGCSHCGVCGLDFGHNIVVPPLPIPPFKGQFQPNINRIQRFRVWFGKQGSMALVSHLDLVRLFERVVRRAALPVSFTGGFRAGPRISIANALPLGATSSGEIVDFELTERLELADFQQRLSAVLPADIPIYQVKEIDIKAPSATKLLDQAEYSITVGIEQSVSLTQWQQWIDQIWQATEILLVKKTKSGKPVTLNLREHLFSLTLISPGEAEDSLAIATLDYRGSCRNDGTLLQPDHLIYILNKVAEQEFELLHTHRQKMILNHLLSLA
jgi:radical SAM-linked protein